MATTIPDVEAHRVLRDPRRAASLAFYYDTFFGDSLLRRFYGDSGFANFGYWDASVRSGAEASVRLVDRIFELAPPMDGALLDVACGEGATTRRLAERVGPERVTAIGLSHRQVEAARRRAPGCSVLQMDACALEFPDASFDKVISVEAAFHFDTREAFLREAHRVLRPGGALVLSDLLMTRGTSLVPRENHLHDAAAYRALLIRCGFHEARVVDATRETFTSFRRHLSAFIAEDASRYTSIEGLRTLWAINVACAWSVRACLLAAGTKPSE